MNVLKLQSVLLYETTFCMKNSVRLFMGYITVMYYNNPKIIK